MYCKIFKKSNEIFLIDYFPHQISYSEFIKDYIKQKYMQLIVTSAKMVKILQTVHESKGIISFIKLSEDLYDGGKEQVQINNKVEQINEKMRDNEIIEISNLIYHSDEDSIDIQSIKCKYENVYFEVLANGIIKFNQAEDKVIIKKVIEFSLL
ncbi:hypothetical protein [Salinicoccus halodurans]|uniref:Uncharacterized protein n=1 Tax=Salinicoccus halodurans TaxID=407035 RepID=A0A0F7HLK3_9STAP|nr:hypothetical protein [Salinicoccus halodurans]AKG74187.1 hypothetical protein AAT16_08040 [Salinicoccus halodurans]SFK61749.1 hypothetical protein SAMN05216235_0856 [Salinicoccus halodurans]